MSLIRLTDAQKHLVEEDAQPERLGERFFQHLKHFASNLSRLNN